MRIENKRLIEALEQYRDDALIFLRKNRNEHCISTIENNADMLSLERGICGYIYFTVHDPTASIFYNFNSALLGILHHNPNEYVFKPLVHCDTASAKLESIEKRIKLCDSLIRKLQFGYEIP